MTSNQRRAIFLANLIVKGYTDPANLSEIDWSLLLLAAGLYRVTTPPVVVAARVLANAEALDGYFSETMAVHLNPLPHSNVGRWEEPALH